MLLIDKHKLGQKYNNFGYLSTQFWLKGNDKAWVQLGQHVKKKKKKKKKMSIQITLSYFRMAMQCISTT